MPYKNTPRQVLIAEDEPIISKVLVRILKTAGLEADVAENGLAATEMIDAGKDYELYLLDIRTPVINGMQLYEYMHEIYPEMTAKVIFMSGDYLNAATFEFLERVKRPFIAKPFTPDQIMDLVKKTLHAELIVL